MRRTNFDRFLAEQLSVPAFAARFKSAGEAWDVALQLTALREEAYRVQKSKIMNEAWTLKTTNPLEHAMACKSAIHGQNSFI